MAGLIAERKVAQENLQVLSVADAGRPQFARKIAAPYATVRAEGVHDFQHTVVQIGAGIFQFAARRHEGELGVVIGRTARKLSSSEDPLNYVFGYTCVNDVTARDLQRKDVQFTLCKSFDTFCPVGPWIETDVDPNNAAVETRLNGEVKQKGNTADMAFPVSFLIRYISEIMTLYPGDLIATGTPAGVSRMKHGDTVEVEVTGIGVLRNRVR